MNNYRVTFSRAESDLQISYWDKFTDSDKASTLTDNINFEDSNDYFYPYIKRILDRAREIGIRDIWFFYELSPNVEITWLTRSRSNSELLLKYIEGLCKREGFVNLKYLTPKDGKFGDWYHAAGNEREREFGAKRHALCCEFVKLYNQYKDSVDNGKGIELQLKRSIHTLANPLGINYKTEAKICFFRAWECATFYNKTAKRLFNFYRKYINKNYIS